MKVEFQSMAAGCVGLCIRSRNSGFEQRLLENVTFGCQDYCATHKSKVAGIQWSQLVPLGRLSVTVVEDLKSSEIEGTSAFTAGSESTATFSCTIMERKSSCFKSPAESSLLGSMSVDLSAFG